MIKRCLSVALAGLLICACGVRLAYAESNEEKPARFVEEVKEGITRLGTGREAQVKIKLRDKSKVEGYISETGEDHFVVVNSKSEKATRVAFSDLMQVKENNLSKGAKIGVTLAAVAVIAVLMIVGAPRN